MEQDLSKWLEKSADQNRYRISTSSGEQVWEPSPIDELMMEVSSDIAGEPDIDPDAVAFYLWMQQETGGTSKKVSHGLSGFLKSETADIRDELKISKEEAKELARERAADFLDKIAITYGPARALEAGWQIFGKPTPELQKFGLEQVSQEGFSFDLNINDVNIFLRKVSGLAFLKSKDIKDVSKKIFERDALSRVGSAVQDVLVEEFAMDSATPLETHLIRLHSILIKVSSTVDSVLKLSRWLKANIDSNPTVVRQWLTDIEVKERIETVIGRMNSFFNEFEPMCLGIIAEADVLIASIKENRLRKPSENLHSRRMLMTEPIRMKVEELISKIKALFLDMGAQNSSNVTAGSEYMNAFSNMYMTLQSVVPEMETFSDTPEEKEYVKEEAGVAKLDSAYEVRSKRSGNVVSYMYSVSDGVTTTLRGLGVDDNTIRAVRGTISKEIFSRPGLDADIVAMISDKIIRNFDEAIS